MGPSSSQTTHWTVFLGYFKHFVFATMIVRFQAEVPGENAGFPLSSLLLPREFSSLIAAKFPTTAGFHRLLLLYGGNHDNNRAY